MFVSSRRVATRVFLLCLLTSFLANCNVTATPIETASVPLGNAEAVRAADEVAEQEETGSDEPKGTEPGSEALNDQIGDAIDSDEGVSSQSTAVPTRISENEEKDLNVIEQLVNAAQSFQGDPLDLSLTPFASGFNEPVAISSTNDGKGRLFVVERPGRISIVEPDGAVLETPFLDITSQVDTEWESGLLGLAFPPNYYESGYFYVNYVHVGSSGRQTRISRFSVSATNTDVADPGSEEILLTVNQPAANHNAGDIHFGPDGYLYIPLGDGGASENGQDMTTLLGKITRIDVDGSSGINPDCFGAGTGNYTIPGSNPFADDADGSCDEIWASGLRNPWRSSFDRLTGDLYLGDVGEYSREEIDFQAADTTGGENYGWPCYEAHEPFFPSACQGTAGVTFPIFDYGRADGSCSVIGGYVYRGDQYPAMAGRYLSTDFCSGNVWDIAPDGAGGWTVNDYPGLLTSNFVSFGEATNCELYVSNIYDGTVYHLEENSTAQSTGIISALCNERPATVDDGYSVSEGETLNVSAPGVLANDDDINGDNLAAVLIAGPKHGELIFKVDGSFSYSADEDFPGSDQFTYQASDSIHQSRIATVTISGSSAFSESAFLPVIDR